MTTAGLPCLVVHGCAAAREGHQFETGTEEPFGALHCLQQPRAGALLRSWLRRDQNGEPSDAASTPPAARSSHAPPDTNRRLTNPAAQCFPSLFFVGITAPAHLRRCASAQPVANDAERPETHACAPSRQVAHTLHPFATGCIGKCLRAAPSGAAGGYTAA